MSRKSTSEFVSFDSNNSNPNEWEFNWPNAADYNFNFYKLLDINRSSGIGKNNNPSNRIAIIGAGLAGLTVARELFRSGYTNIDIFESTEKNWRSPVLCSSRKPTRNLRVWCNAYSFFTEPGSKNSLTDFYCSDFNITTQPFPNPGSSVCDTGIFINGGLGVVPENNRVPKMDIWKKEDEKPPEELLKKVHAKWGHFAEMVQKTCAPLYNKGFSEWEPFWQKMASQYWDLNFLDLVYKPAIETYNSEQPGYFGGLGMTNEEAKIFYVIGAGDGGWGAFFHIGALYPIRTLLFGFGTNHQLIQGRFNAENGAFINGPAYKEELEDNGGSTIDYPRYLGVQSIAESLFYLPVESEQVDNISLFEASKRKEYNINLYLNTPAKVVEALEKGIRIGSEKTNEKYDAVALTSPTWALHLNMEFNKFGIKKSP